MDSGGRLPRPARTISTEAPGGATPVPHTARLARGGPYGGGAHLPGLYAGHADLARSPSGAGPVEAERPGADADHTALSEAFGGEFPPSPQGAARLRRTGEGGGDPRRGRRLCRRGRPLGARRGHRGGGGRRHRPGAPGPGRRRRGHPRPGRAPLGRGTRSVWPEYSGGGSRRVYGRGGFRLGGTRLYVSLEV
ncbi:hypothetical protein K1Y78_30300 [Streptomyces sp. tea 10]|nr:hypothetical protein [Streptomyces sp. tea 10]